VQFVRTVVVVKTDDRLVNTGLTVVVGVLDASLFGNLAEHVDGDTIDEAVDRCPSKVQ
jgi:hypothetical protein